MPHFMVRLLMVVEADAPDNIRRVFEGIYGQPGVLHKDKEAPLITIPVKVEDISNEVVQCQMCRQWSTHSEIQNHHGVRYRLSGCCNVPINPKEGGTA